MMELFLEMSACCGGCGVDFPETGALLTKVVFGTDRVCEPHVPIMTTGIIYRMKTELALEYIFLLFSYLPLADDCDGENVQSHPYRWS